MYETLLYEVSEGVATLTLDRPERHNAFNVAMAGELRDAWERIKGDGDVVCVIVTGAGEKAFCTGMDVADVADGSARDTADSDDPPWLHLTALQNRCGKPVITALNGMVVGGGLHFVADSDLILAADHVTLFDTHVKVGLIAGLEPVGLARRMPLEAVLRMALLGGSERLDAASARELGLVGEVLPAAELMPRARELAAKIAQHSPTALARTKKAIWESLDVGLHEGLANTWRDIQAHTGHPDLDEGTKAFVEKRKPRWAPYSE
ncbi:MAG: enoyl-CoA hydratase/isomerase family protein [Myxococcota bacterium]